MKLCNLFENNSNMPGGRPHLKSISQEEDSSGIEGYIVDTVQVQLDNYLSSERAPPSLVSELRNKYSRIGIIKNIWVDDDQRSTGIGSGILETAIDEASDDGAQAILLVAQADDQQDQPKLVKWYESYGFSRIGVTSSGYPVLLLELDTDQSLSENFADGRGPGRPGDSQRHGIPKNATMAQLEKAARAPGRKGQLARWQINMRRGQKKESIAESGSSMIDNTKGWGATPNNQEVDYKGLRVQMRPSVFLKLAAPLSISDAVSSGHIQKHLQGGGKIGSPFSLIQVPDKWRSNDFSQPAKVVSHEGRNRMYAVMELNNNQPIETHLFFTDGTRARHILPAWIERLNQGMIPQDQQGEITGPLFDIRSQPTQETSSPSATQITSLEESVSGEDMIEIFNQMHHEGFDNPEMEQYILDHQWGIRMVQPSGLPTEEDLFDKDDPFNRVVEIDPGRVNWYVKHWQAGRTPNPIIMGPGGSVIDGNHRAQAARELDQPIQAYVPMEKVDEEVWDKPNPRKKHKKLSTKQKAAARARAHRAGRPYPNLIDNMWASNRNNVTELFQGPATPYEKRWEILNNNLLVTRFDFQGHDVEIEMNYVEPGKHSLDRAGAELALRKANLEMARNAQGFLIIFRVDDSTDVTGNIGPSSSTLFAKVLYLILGFLKQHDNKWDYITFQAREDNRFRLYMRMSELLANKLNAEVVSYGHDIAVYKPSAITK